MNVYIFMKKKSLKIHLKWHPLTFGYLFLISLDSVREWTKCYNNVDVRATKVEIVAMSKSHYRSKFCLYPGLFTNLKISFMK